VYGFGDKVAGTISVAACLGGFGASNWPPEWYDKLNNLYMSFAFGSIGTVVYQTLDVPNLSLTAYLGVSIDSPNSAHFGILPPGADAYIVGDVMVQAISPSASSDPFVQANFLEWDRFGLPSSLTYVPQLQLASSPIRVDPYEAIIVWATAGLWLCVSPGPGFVLGDFRGSEPGQPSFLGPATGAVRIEQIAIRACP